MKAMKTVSTLALACALAIGGMAASPALAKEKKEDAAAAGKPSPKMLPAAVEIQGLIAKKDYENAKPKLAAAEALIATDDDKLYIGQFYLQVGQGTNDNALLGKGIDYMIASGKAPAAAQPALYANQGTLAFNAKDYAKAAQAMQQAYKLGSTDPNVIPVLIETMRSQPVQALTILNEAIDKSVAAGKPVPNEWYARGFTIAYQVKKGTPDYDAARKLGNDLDKKWVVAQPTGATWHDALLMYQDGVAADADLKIDINRLMLASNALHSAPEYLEYAELVYLKNPGEAKAVLDSGVKKGLINLASNRNASEINGIVSAKVAGDKAALPGAEKSARAAANGRVAISVADGYYGYGEYAKAVDLYNVAIQKGGIDANVANTRIGAALFQSGDKAGAKAAFAKVTGPRKDLADFWTILVDHPTSDAAAAPAAPAK